MASIRQTSFGAGELSPLLWGRTDSPLYRQGLRRMRDFFPSRHAMAVSRPGTQYLGQAYANLPSRLVPFLVSDSDGYVLEFSSGGSMQVWQNGAKVGVPQVLPWLFTPPGNLQFTQSGDVLTICAYPDVYELRRSGSTFTFSVMSFARKTPEWVRLPDGAKTTVPYIDVTTLLAATTTTPKRPWKWWVTVLLRDAEGRVWETEGYEVATTVNATNVVQAYDGSAAVGLDRPVKIVRRTVGAVWAGTRTLEVLGFNYYRGVGDYSGFVGHTKNELEFTDDGREPDYTTPHPRAVNPFRWTTPTAAIQDRPLTVGYFEDRLVFGGTFFRPVSVLLSETGNYVGWQKPPVALDDQALEFELAVRTRETIRGLLTTQRLLVFTDTSVWSLGGSNGPLTPGNPLARVVSQVGSAPLRPLLVGTDALYARSKGRGLQLVRPSENADGLFSSGDISWHAEHLFRENGSVAGVVDWWRATGKTLHTEIVDWAYQEDPWNLVWMVRADGKLVTLQWDGQLAGYSLHTTGASAGDRFESVCTVPEGDEDAVYVCVQRSGLYNIERFTSRMRREVVADDCCLDCAVQFTGIVPNGTALISVAAGIANGREVWAVAKDNAPIGPVVVSSGKADFTAAGFKFSTANDGSTVTGWVGLLYEPELETLDVASAEARNKQKTVTKVAVEVSDSKGLKVGQYADKLTQWKQRRPADGYGVPSAASEVVEVLVQGGWDLGGRVTLKQSLPLPVTVLGVTREVDGGG